MALDIISHVNGIHWHPSDRSVHLVKRVFGAVALLALLAGCSAKAAKPGAGTAAPSSESLSPAAAALRARLTNSDNGLEVRRWVIADHTGRIAQAMRNHADGLVTDQAQLESLKRNGLRLVRVPSDQIHTLLTELGGANYDATEWHGQVLEWRSLVERPIDPAGQTVAIDGQVQRYQGGEFRLMVRSWNVQMESGPYLHFELSPRRRLVQANNLRRLLNNEGDLEQYFGSMSLEVQLEAGYMYVLTGESPEIEWQNGEDVPAAGSRSGREGTSRRGGLLDVGPEAAPPPTMGELLFSSSSATGTRGVLVIVPKIAAELFLPEQLAAREQQSSALKSKREGGT